MMKETLSEVINYRLSVAGGSDKGLVRENNEDFWCASIEDQFFILADGMGGHKAGEVAAHEAVDALARILKNKTGKQNENEPQLTTKFIHSLLYQSIQEVNESIYKMGVHSPTLKGMGTTLCCLFFYQKYYFYAHVGDSRIYKFSQDKLKQITRDHSLLRELIELGQLSERDGEGFFYKNILTKAIGTESHVEPSVAIERVQTGDLFLMCTDGLTDLLTDRDIESVLKKKLSPAETVNVLIEMAKKNGGYDNITVIILKVEPD